MLVVERAAKQSRKRTSNANDMDLVRECATRNSERVFKPNRSQFTQRGRRKSLNRAQRRFYCTSSTSTRKKQFGMMFMLLVTATIPSIPAKGVPKGVQLQAMRSVRVFELIGLVGDRLPTDNVLLPFRSR